jgi:6-phosphogluconolactonase
VEAAVIGGTPPQVRVFPDPEALGRAAAEFFVALSKKTIASQGRCTVALSGGSTPHRLYTLLGSPPHRNDIDWKQVHVFWADERCVPEYHEESNFKLAVDALLSRVAIPRENIHRIKGEDGPECAAEEYDRELRFFFGTIEFPVFDLVLLGAGDDGHTASLFPGSPALRERTRLAVAVHLEAPKPGRVTLTLPVLNHAAQTLFLASGHGKAGVVRAILENGNPLHYPAGLVQPVRGGVTWFVDKQAAGLLTAQGHT